VISFTLAKIGKILFIYAHTAIFDIVHLHSLAEFIKFQVFFVFKLSKHEEQAYKLAYTFIFCSFLLYKV